MLRHPIYRDYIIDRVVMKGVNSHRPRILFGGVTEGLPGLGTFSVQGKMGKKGKKGKRPAEGAGMAMHPPIH